VPENMKREKEKVNINSFNWLCLDHAHFQQLVSGILCGTERDNMSSQKSLFHSLD
jgi:hypothetical protein